LGLDSREIVAYMSRTGHEAMWSIFIQEPNFEPLDLIGRSI